MAKIAAKKPGYGKHQLYAEIYDSDWHRVSFGWNHSGRSDLIEYVRHEAVDGTCAEAAAVIQAISRYRPLHGATLLVSRAKKPYRGGPIIPGYARPCAGCRRLMQDFGIARVYYTSDTDGIIMSMKIEDME